jgi:hypothetical protein
MELRHIPCFWEEWLKQGKTHHNWGENILTIISEDIMVTLSTIKHGWKGKQAPSWAPRTPLERF